MTITFADKSASSVQGAIEMICKKLMRQTDISRYVVGRLMSLSEIIYYTNLLADLVEIRESIAAEDARLKMEEQKNEAKKSN